jgi:ABC-type dipeptide/oligopeptide/nickel transport system permease subunit
MASLFSRDRRIIYARRISQFWDEYKTKKIGLLGLTLLTLYVLMAVFAPFITPYNPMTQPRLAQAFAMPEWVTILPQFKDLTTTREIPQRWNVTEGSEFVKGWDLAEAKVQYETKTMQLVQVKLSSKFSHTEKAPNEFFQEFIYAATNITDLEYSITLSLLTPEGDTYVFYRPPTLTEERSQKVTSDSSDPQFIAALGFELQENIGNILFSQKGDYIFELSIQLRPLSKNASAQVIVKNSKLVLLGHIHGLMGTEYLAKDIFTQLVYGAQLSLSIGLLAALVGTTIGIVVGVVSGYLGGAVDEILMRVVDVLLCLPLLPLLLALVELYGRNVYYIVLFIAIFGWQGLARVIRSQTLSIRETTYIETAKASGASGSYIMLRHIIPNIIPVAFASMILAVPSAILFEAALSFLGFGDESVITWGLMLQHAQGSGGFIHLAWWWIIPPGLAIIGLCLAFVFIGYAFDDVVNPRLRRRR